MQTVKEKNKQEKLEKNYLIRIEKKIDVAINNKNSKGTIYLGKVNDFVSNEIQKITGINVIDRIHTLSDYDIRHMMKEHGNKVLESEKNQIAISKRDIKNIPNIINEPTNIEKGSNNKLGKTIRYIKKYNNNITYVIEVVPDNSNKLIIKTMWKKPSTLINSISTLNSTSKTKGSDISSTSNNNLSQSNDNVNYFIKEEITPYNIDKSIILKKYQEVLCKQ